MVKGQMAKDPYALRDPYEKGSREAAPRDLTKGEPQGGAGAQGGKAGAAAAEGAAGSHGEAAGEEALYEEPRAFGNKQLVVALCIALALLVAAGAYAWSIVRTPDISAYADQEIAISGLMNEDFTVTPAELAQLKCAQLTVDGQGKGQGQDGESKAGTVTAYGPTLARFLEGYGYEPGDFSRIVFTCSDGYKVTLLGDALDGTIVLSIAQGKKALDEHHQPLRLVVPEEESGKWCYGVTSIRFELASSEDGNSADQGVFAVEESQLGEAAAGVSESGDAEGSASGSGSGVSFGQL